MSRDRQAAIAARHNSWKVQSRRAARRKLIHVLHVVHQIGDGGADHVLTRLVNRSDPKRFRHTVLLLRRGSGHEPLRPWVRVVEGTEVTPAPVALVRARLNAIGTFDLVHGWVPRASILAAGLAAVLGLPVVLRQPTNVAQELAVEPDDSRTYWPQLRRAYEMADAVIVPSPALVACTHDICGVREPVVIPNAIDVDVVQSWYPRPLDGRSPASLAFTGRLCRQKDPMTLIDALALVNRTLACDLTLYGEGYLRSEIEHRCRELGIRERVTFAGFHRDWLSRAAGCDAFVLPTRFEGMSNAVLEAAAAAMPIVTTDIPENRTILEHAVDSLLVPAGSPQALAAAILETLQDRDASVVRGRQARERVRRLSLEQMVTGHERVYATLADAKHASGAAA